MSFEGDLLALEQRVLKDAAGSFLVAVDELRQMLVTGAGSVERKLAGLALTRITEIGVQGVAFAYALGGAEALSTVFPSVDNAVQKRRVADRVDTPPLALSVPLVGLDALVFASISTARLLLSSGVDVQSATSPVFDAATSVRASIVTQINTASNQAFKSVAQETDSPLVWQAERDACVYCLGLAGAVVEKAGNLFPQADLYADGSTSKVTVDQPPLHPNCRCTLAILVDQSYADALEREAQRSILRGFALPSESNGVRVRAAQRLLAKDPVAPKSVKAYAAKAIREGRFPRGRDVPAGDPRLKIT